MSRRVLVCGSRTWRDYATILVRLEQEVRHGSTIVHGACPRGADALADRAAHAFALHVERYPADWKRYGKKAGPIRNREMVATKPDHIIAFWNGRSPGTLDMMLLGEECAITVEMIAGP